MFILWKLFCELPAVFFLPEQCTHCSVHAEIGEVFIYKTNAQLAQDAFRWASASVSICKGLVKGCSEWGTAPKAPGTWQAVVSPSPVLSCMAQRSCRRTCEGHQHRAWAHSAGRKRKTSPGTTINCHLLPKGCCETLGKVTSLINEMGFNALSAHST